MCGISGLWSPKANGDELRAIVAGMTTRLVHRGPDAGGVRVDEEAGCALGHRRLAVLDLSPQGAQPMSSADGRYVLTFNGEIYNHLELRRAVERRGGGSGTAWRGRSDTESLVEAVAAFGFEETLARCSGMFALAVWDRRDRILRLAVDRMGEKPLFYGTRRGEFFFASEPKAFRALPDWAPEINRESLSLLLRFGHVPAPHAIWKGVRKLEPGCRLEVGIDASAADGFVVRSAPYWDLRAVARHAFANRFRGDDHEAADALEDRLRAVVARQMVADAPLGASLSGGVDSSVIVALMQAQSSSRVKTFTIGFDSPGHDEADDARRVAAHLGTDHVEERLDPRAALDLIPALPEVWCEPFADPAQLPALLLARMTRRHVTVCLTGDGGDELFAGYNRHVWEHGPGRRLGALPLFVRRMLAAGLRGLSPGAADALFSDAGRGGNPGRIPHPALRVRLGGEKLGKLIRALEAANSPDRYRGLVSAWADPGLLLPGVAEPPGWIEDAADWTWCSDPVERMQLLDGLNYLPGVLTKVDRAAMAFGLETRAPFLDPELTAFALSLPMNMKIRGGLKADGGKWLLRQVLHRHVPRELVDRPKMGFAVPLDAWLRGPLRDWAEALLDEARLKREGILEPMPIRRIWQAHISGKARHHEAIWPVLMFQAWRERWLDGAPA